MRNSKILSLKNLLRIVFFLAFIGVGFDNPAKADTLKTPNYRVTIERNCPEGNVVCNNVTYKGENIKTGQVIQLIGKTVHSPGADGVIPGHFLGYEFSNGEYHYFVTDNGTLQVYRGEKLLLQENGNWKQ